DLVVRANAANLVTLGGDHKCRIHSFRTDRAWLALVRRFHIEPKPVRSLVARAHQPPPRGTPPPPALVGRIVRGQPRLPLSGRHPRTPMRPDPAPASGLFPRR